MSLEQDVQVIEMNIDVAKERMAFRDDIDKLYRNPTFKKVFVEHYFKSEPVRITMMKAAPSQQGDQEQKELNKMLDAIGYLDLHLRSHRMMGDQAEKAIHDMEEERDAMQQEDLLNG